MSKISKRKGIELLGIFSVFILTPIVLYIYGIDFLMITIVCLWALTVLIAIQNFDKNVFFICFLCSLFVFLVSGDLAEQLSGQSYWLTFSENAIIHSRICILISILFLLLGYCIKSSTKKHIVRTKKNKVIPNDVRFIDVVEKVSKYFFLLTYIILIITTLEKVVFSQTYSYDEYYISYVSRIPRVISKIGDFTPIALCFFLGTFPSKKRAMPIIGLYFVYSVLAMFIGQRGAFIYNAAFLLGYLVYRNVNDKEKWIKKSQILLVVCMLPFLFVFLMVFQYTRSNETVVYNSFFDTLVSFFVNIGASSKVIKYGYEYKSEIEEVFKFFSLGEIITYFKFSDIFSFISGYDVPEAYTSRFALEGNKFGEYITYLAMPSKYVNGYGLGSSYIAELYADFGYVGVALGNILYGAILKVISQMKREQWLYNFAKLYTMLNLIRTPRGEYSKFLGCFINVLHLGFMCCLIMVAIIVWRRNKRNRFREMR